MAKNKVELTGVNTNEHEVLKGEETNKLFNIIKNGTEEEKKNAKERLIKGNLKLVLSILKKYTNRSDNLDDLFQIGVIGLIKAIDNFNVDLGLKLSTYAIPIVFD